MSDDTERLRRENLHLRCTMIEAARELMAFWECHAADGGRGPYLLLGRLLGNIPVSDEENPYPARVAEVLHDK